ncbi:DUF1835 domain-containing protein [Parasediminibacterium sp. JCM 36343]|uniref:DUF1835 domain-containing protein n=1 Tax=Parasediminibacterium sp. JCM 36343 TaxID=3374279 RepID=UPI00397E2DFB
MVHIVFSEADITVLQQAMEFDSSLQGEVIQIKDDFAVGPISNIYEPEGYRQRRDWWQDALLFSPYTEQINIVDDKLTVHNLLKQLEEDTTLELWLWMGQNAHDVCGYYWLMRLMPQLKDFQGRIQVLYMNNLPFINEKGGIFYPTYLHEIQPKEFRKAKKLARPITLSEFETDPDEWQRLCNENGMVRLLEGGKKIVSKPTSFYDKDLLTLLQQEPQKLTKLFSIIFGKTTIKASDVFIAWRYRALESLEQIAVIGEWERGWKEITCQLLQKT